MFCCNLDLYISRRAFSSFPGVFWAWLHMIFPKTPFGQDHMFLVSFATGYNLRGYMLFPDTPEPRGWGGTGGCSPFHLLLKYIIKNNCDIKDNGGQTTNFMKFALVMKFANFISQITYVTFNTSSRTNR